ncbi:aldo/keto reductase [Vagococcus xieshaowenii]|uniref:Aldo/keto reductase n=1 Tax=Vagococcus xieshaowenii TaxID=2562451 RepID=A0AAJ5JMH0_9ENTE|nr:aldo/keto reductase [Vagococcus xieshaowenii]QCA28853.1 aldo/keto reductase [Vagococcus xieshaowenii]TFZ43440.1 aldo/keto reductase [Vagococcus xieshaowenii]
MTEYFKLSNELNIPKVGLGTWQVKNNEEASNAVTIALKNGYRLIDTAAIYQNEEAVGLGIKASGIAREDIFVTSKVWNSDQGYDTTIQACKDSLARLQLDYLDLYLIHWPTAGKYVETWRAMETLYKEGLVKAIGVSNFHQHHLEDVLEIATIVPMVNQIELHPELSQEELVNYCKAKGIVVEAYSPLAHGKLLNHPTIEEIASNKGKSIAQIILRWIIQRDIIALPKSITESRIIENGEIFDFKLTDEEMNIMNSLNTNTRVSADPDNFDF